ncbi:MAG: hypothetical protein AAF791_02665 [Bacteroidota bacterium]
MSFRVLCLCSALAVCVAGSVHAQPEVIPAEHPVYEFLLDARASGQLPEYAHEVLPLGRAEVQRHLDSLDTRREALGPGGRRWLDAFRRELSPGLSDVHAWVGDGESNRLDLGAERFLAFSRADQGEIRVLARAGAQARSSDGPTEVGDPLASASGAALLPELVLSGHWRDVIGVYSGTFNGLQVTGDTRVLRADPEIASLYYIGFADVPPGSFDRSSASVRVRSGPFSAEIANERLRIGPSVAEPLILSSAPDYFPFLRAGFETGPVRYQFVHGALSDQSQLVDDGTTFGLVGPERYLALHRLEGRLPRLQVGFTEAVVYGLRGPELAYLNPLFPIKPAEHALWDRDNSLFALDAVAQPIRGVEVYGTYLADDLNFSRIGEAENNNNKWAVQAGASIGGLIPGATVFGEYTRIEPYVYTHRFSSEGSFYNSFTHNGFSLGHPLGPNADQWIAGVRAWLPGGVRARGLVRYARRGENPTDPETGETLQIGGDVRDGTQPSPFTKVFLSGDVFEGPGASLDVRFEPVNSLMARLVVDWQSWDPGPDRLFARFGASVQL